MTAGGFRRFVAIGDSFTEGLDDPYPDGSGWRGWADRVAATLAASAPGFRYANLAVRGRKLAQIVDEQVPAALALAPDLVSVAGGTNDILRPRVEVPALAARLHEATCRLSGSGATVVLFTSGDPSARVPAARRLLPRIRALNSAVRAVAAEFDAVLVDLWEASEVFSHPALFARDRLHLSPEGHRRVAAAVLEALRVGPGEVWRTPPPAPAPRSVAAARMEDARWVRAYLAPWVRRRLTGRSSGDGLVPKRATLLPMDG